MKTGKTKQLGLLGVGERGEKNVVRCHVVHHMKPPNTEIHAPLLYASNHLPELHSTVQAHIQTSLNTQVFWDRYVRSIGSYRRFGDTCIPHVCSPSHQCGMRTSRQPSHTLLSSSVHCLPAYLPIYIHTYLPTYPTIHPSVRPSVRPSIHPSIRPSVYLSIYLSIHPSIHLPTYLQIHTTLLRNVQTSPEAHPASHSTGTGILSRA